MSAWALTAGAVCLVAYAAGSKALARSPVTPAIFFTAAGLVLGPWLGIVDLSLRSEPVKLLAEATLTLVLFSDASRISLGALRGELGVPVRLLGIGLPLTIVAGALAGAAVLPGVSFLEALILAVMIACTDAALGQAVVSDERVPSRIRQGLNVESGLNDGLCVPIFFIALAVAEAEDTSLSASGALRLVSEEIGYGIVGGLVAGILGVGALRLALRHASIEASWLQILTAGTALLAAATATALEGSMFIAAFVAGFVFGVRRRGEGGDVSHFIDEGGELLSAVTFLVFGAAILGPVLGELTWELALYAVLSLTVVRMAPVWVALLGSGARPPTVAFVGWFGPRGIASIVFGVLLYEESDLPGERVLLLATVFTIALSVLAHGVTARPLTDRYARWYAAHPREQRPMESVHVTPLPVRWKQARPRRVEGPPR